MPLKNLLHASFLAPLKGHKHGHVHIGNARIQKGGKGSLESRRGVKGVWNPLENNKFYRKKQLGSITLEKVGPPDIFEPPSARTLEKL